MQNVLHRQLGQFVGGLPALHNSWRTGHQYARPRRPWQAKSNQADRHGAAPNSIAHTNKQVGQAGSNERDVQITLPILIVHLYQYLWFYFVFQGFTYVAPSILEDMHRANRMPARSPRRTPRQHQMPDNSFRLQFPPSASVVGANVPMSMARSTLFTRATPPQLQHNQQHPHPHHMQTFAPRPSPAQDEMMDVQQGLPI